MAESVIGAWRGMDIPSVLRVLRGEFPSLPALARALGVAPRTVQRWYTSAKEQRKPSPKLHDTLKRLLPAILLRVTGLFAWDSPTDSQRTPDRRVRDIEFVVPGENIPALADAVAGRDEDRARQVVLVASYGMDEAPRDIPDGQFFMEPLEGE